MDYIAAIHAQNASADAPASAHLHIFGCQQNLADGDRLRGMLHAMGYALTDSRASADLVVVVTCAVREHAENRVYGHLGDIAKQGKPGQKLVLCGCMAARPEVRERLRRSYPHVRLTFGPSELARFPEYLYGMLAENRRRFHDSPDTLPIAEDLPVLRDGSERAYVTVMTGCDNFCSYCVVPYVRGRERSRPLEAVLAEVEGLAAEGYKEIWLLGQNVNSYQPDFPLLLRKAGAFSGDYQLRFMTSHPRDAGEALFRAIAETPKVAPFLHLPVQSGSDNVLKRMNRGYTRDEYMDKVALARKWIPNLNLTGDVMVGFPGETEEDFADTLDLVRRVRYNSLFTFIYSARPPAPAAEWDMVCPEAEVKERFARLLALQKEMEALDDGIQPHSPI